MVGLDTTGSGVFRHFRVFWYRTVIHLHTDPHTLVLHPQRLRLFQKKKIKKKKQNYLKLVVIDIRF